MADKTEMIGADISWVPEQEDNGVRFFENGQAKDILTILTSHGFNWVRLRLFHNPKAKEGYSEKGYCNLERTLQMAKRTKAAGMKLLLNFHYSDTWADPAHQHKPEAWKDLTGRELEKALNDYTVEVLTAFRKQGTSPDMVQIGNEITPGFLWPDGQMWSPGRKEPFCNLLKAAISGAKDVLPKTPLMLHIATGGRNGQSRAFFDCVTEYKVPYDVIGVSYYARWEGPTEKLRDNVTDLVTRYKKDVVVVEYSDQDGEAVYKILRDLPGGRGLGAFIWEPTKWPMEEPALFDKQGKTKPILNTYPFPRQLR